jgi:uncharacterized protein YbjT (DUF2867 family)
MQTGRKVFITGGTGYIGGGLIPRLLARGHCVVALARSQSQGKLPAGCRVVCGDALDGDSYSADAASCDTFVQLVGVAHPSPKKAREFVSIDQKSAMEAIRVARQHGARHFVYLSVAHPAPVMRAYIEARSACEDELARSGLNATVLRPWYVLGPGHRWPYALLPLYWIAGCLPRTRESARRLGLVTRPQIIAALVEAIENPAEGIRIVEVPRIRSATV